MLLVCRLKLYVVKLRNSEAEPALGILALPDGRMRKMKTLLALSIAQWADGHGKPVEFRLFEMQDCTTALRRSAANFFTRSCPPCFTLLGSFLPSLGPTERVLTWDL